MTETEKRAFDRWCLENHDVVIDHWDGYDRMEVARLAWEAAGFAKQQPVLDEKLHNMMLAHLDGVYRFSARENCDDLVTQLTHIALASHRNSASPSEPEA